MHTTIQPTTRAATADGLAEAIMSCRIELDGIQTQVSAAPSCAGSCPTVSDSSRPCWQYQAEARFTAAGLDAVLARVAAVLAAAPTTADGLEPSRWREALAERLLDLQMGILQLATQAHELAGGHHAAIAEVLHNTEMQLRLLGYRLNDAYNAI